MATFDTQTVGSDVSPSYDPTLEIENNIIIQKLGDGYENRLRRGLNTSVRTYTLDFLARSDITVTNILAFLSSSTGGNNGAKSFTWLPPYGATGKWVCASQSVTKTAYNLNDISLTFREVFEV
tara:strand:- start:137 stop:505 length:369 start_codon:yes stop_codon:yes gene_type:complete